MKPYRTDGCTGWLQGDWQDICEEHDRDHWRGGTLRQMLQSHWRMKRQLQRRGRERFAGFSPNATPTGKRFVLWASRSPRRRRLVYDTLAWTMFAGVLVGALPWWPTAWRWGFGHTWPRYR